MGNAEYTSQGEVIKTDLEVSKKGGLLDRDGKKINQRGYFLDAKGNIIDNKGGICFQKKLISKDGNLPLVFRPVINFDEERRYSVFIIPRSDRAQIMENQIIDSQGNEEQEFQVKIDVGTKNKMYATASNFGRTLASNEMGLGTQVDYKSQTGAESPIQNTNSGWRKKSNMMKRLSLDLPEAFG